MVSLKISPSALKRTVVPFWRPSVTGPLFKSSVTALPRSNRWVYSTPSLTTSTSSHSDRAFTTEAPTPWRPLDTL